jgi:hypothetical protein
MKMEFKDMSGRGGYTDNISLYSPGLDPACFSSIRKKRGRHWWLMPVILATQEAEIRIVGHSQPRQIVLETLS